MRDQTAIVQPATDAIAELGAAFRAFEDSGRKRLEAAVRIGGILAEQKKACGHGNWLKWLDAHFPYTPKRAAEFMRVYAERAKCNRAVTFEDALRLIADEPEQPEPAPAPPAECIRAETSEAPPHPAPAVEPDPEPDADADEPDDEPDAPPAPVDEWLPGTGTYRPDWAPALDPDRESPKQRPEWMKPGNNSDPDHPHAELLRSATAFVKALNKALNAGTDEAAILRGNLFECRTLKLPPRPCVQHFNGDNRTKFVGLALLRSVIRKSTKKLNQVQLARLAASVCEEAVELHVEEGDE